jgi:protein-S-isoprenylcysteine O-methyltransferase Ste14
MDLVFKSILTGYFILFVCFGLLYRSYIIYKKTSINALNQVPEDRTLKILAFAFKIHLLLVLGLIIDYTNDFGFLTARRFEFIDPTIAGSLGSILLVLCLALIIHSQNQMKSSWRIEIDSSNKAELITEGIFKYSRNPIFLALRVSYFAMFLIIPCPYSLFVFLIGDVCFQLQARKEEQYLQNIYGEEYKKYSSHVRRWL